MLRSVDHDGGNGATRESRDLFRGQRHAPGFAVDGCGVGAAADGDLQALPARQSRAEAARHDQRLRSLDGVDVAVARNHVDRDVDSRVQRRRDEGVLVDGSELGILRVADDAVEATRIDIPVVLVQHIVVGHPLGHRLEVGTRRAILDPPLRDGGGLTVRRGEILLPLEAVGLSDLPFEGLDRIRIVVGGIVVGIHPDHIHILVAGIGLSRIDLACTLIHVPDKLEVVGNGSEHGHDILESLDEGLLVPSRGPGHPGAVEFPAQTHIDGAVGARLALGESLRGLQEVAVVGTRRDLLQRRAPHRQRNGPDTREPRRLRHLERPGDRTREFRPAVVVQVIQRIGWSAPCPGLVGIEGPLAGADVHAILRHD